jgi:hypothetical protein
VSHVTIVGGTNSRSRPVAPGQACSRALGFNPAIGNVVLMRRWGLRELVVDAQVALDGSVVRGTHVVHRNSKETSTDYGLAGI